MIALEISNDAARRLFLERHALGSRHDEALDHDDLLGLVQRIGFVQLDSVNAVERAHHMILFSRAAQYERELLHALHHDQRALFEHWTHDASLIPMEFYPHWQHRFRAAKARSDHPRWRERFGPEPEKTIRKVRARIRRDGEVSTRDFEDKGAGGWWGWGPSKTALEYLWRTGELAIARRDGFEKIYDLSERVIPADLRAARPTRKQTIDWACREALARLGFATPTELAGFFDLIEIAEAKEWTKAAMRRKNIIEVNVEGADGGHRHAFAPASIEADIAALPDPHEGTRLLSPFDPAIRDRKRTQRLFGFDYTIEIFVPEAKRRYGYYVLPILEGTRFSARADLKVHRAEDRLEVKGFWLEPGVKLDRARKTAVETALEGLARFTGVTQIDAAALRRPARAG
ncbi:winged helix-turn-helix domain-containing protein [Parvibaculum sedimenti]|uniref:winged helix-turn-helix domain-containing protein n=1 Tax=Parvibaculum sedimenti TaxID=2608632 RepID=UPI0031B5D074